MTIEIDDSGTGDLVGDAFIGFYRKDMNKLLFKTLPVDLFKGENLKNKMPLKKTVDLVKEGLEELKFNRKSEKVLLCRGNIFDDVRTYFIEEGILYEDAIIEGKLQYAVERRLINHLRHDLGIRSKSLTIKSGARRYFVLFNWVSYDFYKREKHVKSGFKKWNTIWREKAIEKYEDINANKNRNSY